ncbi:uncharacterized protein LOC117620865 [Prunus dulcis]|uniref:uncharacterized protein LOC117620865 n=1 Tax=Prunus dulcis TaxID=3755 RepID=UPI001483A90D|nr:uncharacterized protein LOC117620865 [Prunus dulcis]
MQEFKRTHRPIPLDCIHPRWKKLDFLEPRPIATSNNPPENAQLELFVKWFQSCSSETKRHVSMKLQEIMNPTSTTLTQPQLKIKTKGRPKVDTSTRHLPSAFEVVLFGQDSAHSIDKVVTRPPCKKPMTIPQKRSVFNSQTQPLPYVNPKKRPSKLPVYRPKPIVDDSCLTPEGAQDVKSDGNCGFRAIGSLMGFGDNAWRKVHRDLLKELRKESVIYELILNGKEWPLTFFPYETAPLDSIYRREISIGFVNHNHWIKVYLEGQHPMPPVDERWLRCATITASDWLTPYQDRIRQFRYEAGIADPYDNDHIFIE